MDNTSITCPCLVSPSILPIKTRLEIFLHERNVSVFILRLSGHGNQVLDSSPVQEWAQGEPE